MHETALRYIQKYHMIRQGDRILAALSGGADSVALLHFLSRNRAAGGYTLGALHFNHRLRGAESDRDEAFAAELCRSMDIPITTGAEDIAARAAVGGQSVELCARECRYAFFRREAERQGAKVATAHTRSDNAETMLLNLARGTGLRGLSGIPPVREMFIRPLLGCTRMQVEAYCARHGLAYVEDSTNREEIYTRNYIRRRVLPELAAVFPEMERAFGEAAELLRADADYLDSLARRELALLECPDGFDRQALLALPQALAARVLRFQLVDLGLPYDRERIEQLLLLLQEGKGAAQLSGGVTFRCAERRYRFAEEERRQPYFEKEILWEDVPLPLEWEPFPGKTLQISVVEREIYKEIVKNDNRVLKNGLDCATIEKIVILRQRKPGDRYRPAGRGCTKTLRKLFNEARLGMSRKERVAVLESGGNPVWVEGFGVGEGCKVTAETQRVMLVMASEEGDPHAGGH